jgi:glycosyltransferase involved in cell wall biosynthesis
MPSISILIPLFNGIEFIDECVQSVINQTFTDWELLIGINHHHEETCDYIRKEIKKFNDPRIKVLAWYEKGKSKTLNKLVQVANADWICLLDIDDLWMPTKLEKQILIAANTCNAYQIIGTDAEYFGEKEGNPNIFLGRILPKMFRWQNPMINSAIMMRKEDALWKDEWEMLDDYNMWLYLLGKGRRFYNVPEVLTKHRIHSKSYFNLHNKADGDRLMNHIPELNEEDKLLLTWIMDEKRWLV